MHAQACSGRMADPIHELVVGAEEGLSQHVLLLQELLQGRAKLQRVVQDVRQHVVAHERVAKEGVELHAGVVLPSGLQAMGDALGSPLQCVADCPPVGLHGLQGFHHCLLEALLPAPAEVGHRRVELLVRHKRLFEQGVHLRLDGVQIPGDGRGACGLQGRRLDRGNLATEGLVRTLGRGLVDLHAKVRGRRSGSGGQLPGGQVELPGHRGGRLLHHVERRLHTVHRDGGQPGGLGEPANAHHELLELLVQLVPQGVRLPPVRSQRLAQAGEAVGRRASILVEAHDVVLGLEEGWLRHPFKL
mmetsp:Transcript_23722/g.64532  ORF Transcript_23722/g.64532 Transcript_23722/m.64532 type:complete len:302 (+) Transcript_23722:434-1339(+)